MLLNKSKLIIHSKTNTGDLAKQYFLVASSPALDDALIVVKLVLTKDFNGYRKKYNIVKEYKGWYLFQFVYSIKLNTLEKVFPWLQSLQLNKIDPLKN